MAKKAKKAAKKKAKKTSKKKGAASKKPAEKKLDFESALKAAVNAVIEDYDLLSGRSPKERALVVRAQRAEGEAAVGKRDALARAQARG